MKNHKISFQELAILQQKILSNQQPTSLSKAREQAELLKKLSSQNDKKQRTHKNKRIP